MNGIDWLFHQFASEEEKENHDRLMRKLQDKNKDLRSLQADMVRRKDSQWRGDGCLDALVPLR